MQDLINKITHGDCLEVMKTIPDKSIDLVLTDPPYKITSRGGVGTMGGYWNNAITKKGDIFEHNDISCKVYFPEFYRILKEKTHCYVMCNNLNLQEMINEGIKSGFNFVKCLIWEKGNKICGRYYMGCYEYIILFRKGGDKPINKCGTPDILHIPIKKIKNEDGGNLHDTEKPVDLMKVIIENASNQNDLVLDCFSGSGTTAIACSELKRNFICIEKDKQYYEASCQRLENYNKQLKLF